MQIALTKKLADAMDIKPIAASEQMDSFFVWTANWTNTFDGRKEDMVVMVNGATRFTVTIYGVRRNQFKNICTKMETAIRNTFLSLNINPEIINEYFRQAGEIQFTANHDRKAASHVSKQGLDAAFVVGRTINKSCGRIKYEDTLGRLVSDSPVNYSNGFENGFFPLEKMIERLSTLSREPVYRYHAFELRVTLDLEIYTAMRRLIVPADIEFSCLHHVLQNAFHWENYHLYDFAVFNNGNCEPDVRLVASEEDLDFVDNAILMGGHTLSEFLPKSEFILYTYDMGDGWEHKIELVRDIPECHEESPYLLEAIGQAPPEDVGGVGGYIDFREIMLNPAHPEYEETKTWAGDWHPELTDWESRPRSIRC